jgi:peptidyl-prolyl cis-trans isomerase C
MGLSVNGVDITDAAIEAELPHHGQAANPLKQTVHELVLRELLRQEARRLQMPGADDEARIEALLAAEVSVPAPDEAACRRYYQQQLARFTSGELVEVKHILFQVTPSVPLDLLRGTGEAILAELQAHPDRFAELARTYSNCPSGAVGGSLGQVGRGQCVPEFEEPVFRMRAGELGTRLLETRFGLHIVQVERRIEGNAVPFEAVHAQVADELQRQSWHRALHQYLRILAGRANIEGVELEGAATPLVQ